MTDSQPQILDRFLNLHVLVIGDVMLDSYLEGTSQRLCQEAPVPVVQVTGQRDVPGGAANTAANGRCLGARVSLLGAVGNDAAGHNLRHLLERQGLSTSHLVTPVGRRTLAKQRVVASSQVLVRFDQGDTVALDRPSEDRIISGLEMLFPSCDAVIISDYGYGVMTPRVVGALSQLQARSPRILVADSKRLAVYRDAGLTAVKPNYSEALQLLGAGAAEGDADRVGRMSAWGERILELTGSRVAAVTLDVDGALVFERGRAPYRTYARANPQSRAAGAGDTFASALTLALAAGADTPAAAELASAAASVVVAREGTACCSAAELRAALTAGAKAADLEALLPRLMEVRRHGSRVVFTNGCFDILHRGHVTYLNRAKSLGDVLIVGVNSDDSIRRLKGPGRPINCLEDRLQVLGALSCVDHLLAFEEDTPHRLIRAIRPDIFVKGGDYTRERLPEAALVERMGGVVHILPHVPERSTSNVIQRIRASNGWSNGKPAVPRASSPASQSRYQRNGNGDPIVRRIAP